ncbi:hypothetical protein CHS0354_004958 [Potamilus streckersoni]|uniref:Molybdate-anion transporter n=1 Tax=Potamilus streckersoni TaxID=2493646 RepID=A0AAE0VFF4_9BIVA|nr:hypothetical protein CHS0354_004958 [Potamilus streckersoni]
MTPFLGVFFFLCLICMLLFLYTRSALPPVTDTAFHLFQKTYLAVYLLAMAGDWLQGPHVYALYQSYGMTTHQIEVLFVAGFGSSMILGTVVGSFADKYGRKFNCILYGILYGGACITKHFNNFWILMLGRLLGGTATSILYSAFESWLVYEHHKRNFDSDLLGNIFSHAVLGNSLVAILAGLVAQVFADKFGFVAPFDVSLTVLMIMVILIYYIWPENYGDKISNFQKSFQNAFRSIGTDYKVLSLGFIQSLFEGSMYVFVLEWTPALSPEVKETANKGTISEKGHTEEIPHIPHGHIFAGFMVSIMIGSSLFKLLSKHTAVESFMRPVLVVSSLTLAVPIIFPGHQMLIFAAFLVFECCVGIFWPSMSTMRGKYVPEETRATIMNFFRIPLNMIVVVILLQNLDMKVIFQCCVGFLLLAAIFQQWLYNLSKLPTHGRLDSTMERHDEKIDGKKDRLLDEPKEEVV